MARDFCVEPVAPRLALAGSLMELLRDELLAGAVWVHLCTDSILNRVVGYVRFLDIRGPNMREYTARLKAEWTRAAGIEPRYPICGTSVPIQ